MSKKNDAVTLAEKMADALLSGGRVERHLDRKTLGAVVLLGMAAAHVHKPEGLDEVAERALAAAKKGAA